MRRPPLLAGVLAAVLAVAACGEDAGSQAAQETPTAEARQEATTDPGGRDATSPQEAATGGTGTERPAPGESAPGDPASEESDGEDLPEVLWRSDFAPDYDWQGEAGVVVASRTNGEVVDTGPAGREDVLQIWFGEEGSRWGVDLRHDFDAMGLGGREEVHFSYDVYFPAGFEFIGDGKMPGLAGITDDLEPLDASSGGSYDERSFSVRPMWQADRGVVMYLYARSALARDMRNPQNWGYGIRQPFVKADGSEEDVLEHGTWHRVEQRVKLNTPGDTDGIYELWVDGHKGVSVTDVQYRTPEHPDLEINQLFNAWFFGGPSEEYPTRPNVAFSDRWVITDGYLGEGVDDL